MKQAMMQRYLDFMACEITIQCWDYKRYCRMLRGSGHDYTAVKKEVIKRRDKTKYRENNMSYIQTQVKRAIAGTGEITQAVAQGMEKQIALLIKDVVQERQWLKDNKFHLLKKDYITVRDQYKFRLARLVELQQAIRKEKQKGKYE